MMMMMKIMMIAVNELFTKAKSAVSFIVTAIAGRSIMFTFETVPALTQ